MNRQEEFIILGLMSGTSLDGLDIALCRFCKMDAGWRFEAIAAETASYTTDERTFISSVASMDGKELAEAHFSFSRMMAVYVNEFLAQQKIKPLFIASHGQTIFHRPDLGYTFQLGSGASLAVETGFPVVCDFRSQDVCLGGEGAPLVPKGDAELFSHYSTLLNIGGFANITFQDKFMQKAFDICPANMLLNYLALETGEIFDADGKLAKTGRSEPALLDELNNIPLFYHQEHPQSLGREYFESRYIPVLLKHAELPVNNRLFTACEYIAGHISGNIKRNDGRVLASGGGVHHSLLMDMIRQKSDREIDFSDLVIADFKEAIVFAFLGLLRWLEQPNTLITATGARRSISGGCIYLP